MNAVYRPFSLIINGTTQFIIPVFQRDYSWTESDCEQLLEDILTIAATKDRHHFFGSVVSVSTGDSSPGLTRWLMVDGQQRLATMILLLAALRNHIKATDWKGSEAGPSVDKLNAYFLKNEHEHGAGKFKLVLRRHDQATLAWLLDGGDSPNTISERIKDNFDFFVERMSTCDPEAVYQGIGRLAVVEVTLDRSVDDPQLIFESLNSTGVDLSQSDLIRNFILMRHTEAEQERLYTTYWSKIESLFRNTEGTFDSFVRDYVALKTKASKQEKADRIYAAFRREFSGIGDEAGKLDVFLEELLRFARYHEAFSIGTNAPESLKPQLARLRRLVDVPATLVMRLFDCYDHLKTLNGTDFAQALVLIESYVFRRAICGLQTRGYWQVFANLAYEVDTQRPLESLMVGLGRQGESSRFPDDQTFRKELESRDIYSMRVCFDLLDRLENHGSKEPTDTSKYSIEHIMPQNEKLVPEWRAMLGEDWREVQRTWLHRLGNLTLTGYNSKYSDRPFAEKKTIQGGFEESSVRLNKFVREQAKWTAAEMERRGKDLADRAVAIWPRLVVDKALIDAAERQEMRLRAKRRDVSKVPMSATARNLFGLLQERILKLGPEIIELAEPKSVSYFGPAFFLEVLPRNNRISLLLAIDFNEVEGPAGIAVDASQWKFFANAAHEGGALIQVHSEADIDKAFPIVRQAWERARS